jgi:hypothetical protein
MSEQSLRASGVRVARGAFWFLCCGLACWIVRAETVCAQKAEKKAEDPERAVVGKSLSPKAMIFRRAAPGKDWELVDEKESLYSGYLLLGLPSAQLESANKAVTMTFLSDLDGTSPFPIIENAVILREDPKLDLDFVLDRGRVDLVNNKKEGAAKVRVRVRAAIFDLTLQEPGTRVALETYGRWPRGVRFTKEPGPKDEPTASLVILVLKNEIALKHAGVEFPMKAPPGPALIEWDSVTGMDDAPRRLEKLPPWAASGQENTPVAKQKREALERMRQRVLKKPIGEVIEESLNADNAAERRLGTFAAGAFDQLELLGKALRETKYPDVWDNGVLALRHWIGRAPGQDMILYNALVEKRKYSPVHAETILQLLHSFGDEDLARPELYEALIRYLNHDNLAVRGLAYWHLSRLVPAGKELGYNLMDDKDARTKAIEKWKKLIPDGQVPPKPKVNPEK